MKRKTVFMAILLLAGALGLTGCGERKRKPGAAAGESGPPARDLITEMKEAADGRKIIEADWKAELTMSIPIVMEVIDSLTMQEVVAGQGTLLTDVDHMRSQNAGVMGLGATGNDGIELDMYSEQNGGDTEHVISYVQAEDTWMMDTARYSPETFFLNLTNLPGLENLIDLSVSEYIDDIPCWKIRTEMPASQAEPLFPQDLAVMAAGEPLSFKYMGDAMMEVEFYVEQDGSLPVRMNLRSLGDENRVDSSEGYQLSAVNLTMDYHFPKREKVSIPKKAKKAEISYTGLADWYDMEAERMDALETTGAASMFDQLEKAEMIRDFEKDAPKDESRILWDQDDVLLRLDRVYTDGASMIYADVTAANHSGADLDIFSKGTALNRLMNNKENEDGFDMTLPAGKETDVCLRIPVPEGLKLSDLREISLWLTGSSCENYSSVFDTGVKTIPLSETAAAALPWSGGSVVFENECIRLTAYPQTEREDGCSRLLCFENLCDKPVSVSSEWVKSGDTYLDESVYAELFPQTICYTSLWMDEDSLRKKEIENLAGISLRLSGVSFEAQHYKALFETDTIEIP